jgi:hypothetical protein
VRGARIETIETLIKIMKSDEGLQKVLWALFHLYADNADYILRNNLGYPVQNQAMKNAYRILRDEGMISRNPSPVDTLPPGPQPVKSGPSIDDLIRLNEAAADPPDTGYRLKSLEQRFSKIEKALSGGLVGPPEAMSQVPNYGMGCLLAGPGRGDCLHFLGLPMPGCMTDTYGKPAGWCWSCWKDLKIEETEKALRRLRNQTSEPDSEKENP